jgi:hypothetical protein
MLFIITACREVDLEILLCLDHVIKVEDGAKKTQFTGAWDTEAFQTAGHDTGIARTAEAAFPESAALVYREEGEESSTPAQRLGEISPNLRDSGRLIPPVPEQHTDEKAKAAPAAAMPLRTLTGERQAPSP